MKSKIIWGIVLFIIVLFVIVPFSPRILLCLYEKCYSSTKICLSDFLNYFSNVFTGILGVLLSLFALYSSHQQVKISIATSKDNIRNFIEIACSGFKESHQGKSFRYYRFNGNNFNTYIQTLKSESILNKKDVELCRKINTCVRNIKDEPKESEKEQQKNEISKMYLDFGSESEFTNKIKQILEKLSN